MSARKSAELSPESIARSNRRRLAAEEGALALADVERQSIEIRKNMARLREAREAKQAADAALQATLPAPTVRKRASRAARKPSSTPPAEQPSLPANGS
ncbi:transcriptional regulator [Bradyrhizobium barranii subsp. apii]|uniref:Transcriptional regulator n=2 Tax=Bradyrhizobium barranii TaxID=2992140 RepID=A0A8T5V733_9BRAD|nr:transcriptional regulator [Bradyrhizobium barranii]UPT88130.1 transcriptional regulator [Bradyrhizobium barranii subsp. apii]